MGEVYSLWIPPITREIDSDGCGEFLVNSARRARAGLHEVIFLTLFLPLFCLVAVFTFLLETLFVGSCAW